MVYIRGTYHAVVALDTCRIESLSQRIVNLQRNSDSEKSLADSAEQKVSSHFHADMCSVLSTLFCLLVPDAM